jgi:dihydroorotate dehydrogenase
MDIAMGKPKYQPIYDIAKTFEENLASGPNPTFEASLKPLKLKEAYTFLGFSVGSPFGSSASPTGTDSQYIKRMLDNGYDIVTTKTRRSVQYNPHPVPNVVHIIPGKLSKEQTFEQLPDRTTTSDSDYRTLTIANSFGNNSADPRYWVPDSRLANSYAGDNQLIVTSIVGTIQPGFDTDDYYQDFATTALLAKQCGAKAIEINFSCPNVHNEGVLCYDPEAVAAVARLVKHTVDNTPLIAKVGYFPKPEKNLLSEVVAAVEPYVTAISAINTFAAPIYDEYGRQAMPGKGRLKAGLSGHAVKDLGIDMSKRLSSIRDVNGYSYEVVGVGGVLTADDFQDYRAAGADIVMSATGAMWNPNLALEIKQSLA